jgi:UDP-2-acetamido-3-amino-2,3-dideoxy-glucuronate N-acetyltransferase
VGSPRRDVSIHPTADVSCRAEVGPGTRIWHQAQVREGASIGRKCVLGKGVYVDVNVRIGDRCKLENGVSVFHGFNLDDGVFLGPGAMLLNDKQPRAITPDGRLKSDSDWIAAEGHVGYGASIGGGAILLPGVAVGRFAMVGSGAVVTRDVPDYGLAFGNPARLHGFVCPCGDKLTTARGEREVAVRLACSGCGKEIDIPLAAYRLLRR